MTLPLAVFRRLLCFFVALLVVVVARAGWLGSGCGRWREYIKKEALRWKNLLITSRKRGDSNPRYGNPYVSLANWWFQPLTHTSLMCLAFFLLRCKGRTNFLNKQTF